MTRALSLSLNPLRAPDLAVAKRGRSNGSGATTSSAVNGAPHQLATQSPRYPQRRRGKRVEERREGDRCHGLARVRRDENDIIIFGKEFGPRVRFWTQQNRRSFKVRRARARARACTRDQYSRLMNVVVRAHSLIIRRHL